MVSERLDNLTGLFCRRFHGYGRRQCSNDWVDIWSVLRYVLKTGYNCRYVWQNAEKVTSVSCRYVVPYLVESSFTIFIYWIKYHLKLLLYFSSSIVFAKNKFIQRYLRKPQNTCSSELTVFVPSCDTFIALYIIVIFYFKGGWVSSTCKHLRWTSGLTSQYSVIASLKFSFMQR